MIHVITLAGVKPHTLYPGCTNLAEFFSNWMCGVPISMPSV